MHMLLQIMRQATCAPCDRPRQESCSAASCSSTRVAAMDAVLLLTRQGHYVLKTHRQAKGQATAAWKPYKRNTQQPSTMTPIFGPKHPILLFRHITTSRARAMLC